ncbi:MAG: ATPase, partial [Alphaproteobacteria bacterium]
CRYVGTDLLCYRAAAPAALAARQAATWDPLLGWAARRFGLALAVTKGVMPLPRSSDNDETVRKILENIDPITLTGIAEVTAAAGSLVIGLALWDGWIDAAQAWAASTVDETFQAERWGRDEEAQAMLAARQASLAAGARLTALASEGPPLAKRRHP